MWLDTSFCSFKMREANLQLKTFVIVSRLRGIANGVHVTVNIRMERIEC